MILRESFSITLAPYFMSMLDDVDIIGLHYYKNEPVKEYIDREKPNIIMDYILYKSLLKLCPLHRMSFATTDTNSDGTYSGLNFVFENPSSSETKCYSLMDNSYLVLTKLESLECRTQFNLKDDV